ncbi:MAG TPA: PVC-type heme-binding CxxCH protein [Tepidisphaeraceae bacterium]
MRATLLAAVVIAILASPLARATDANRLAYLDTLDPYYVSRDFPKLTTPQWVGEECVDAVVVLAIDDMRDAIRYETFLRPILNRMEQIDGKAHLSIMTCSIPPDEPRLQGFLKEGVSLETHMVDHPCPLLQKGDLARAKWEFDKCVDQMSAIPNSHPVAFRMPCCDSKNTPSPRFWAEIFNKTTKGGNFLRADSSVFSLFTPDDPALPRSLVINEDGTSRFKRYVPFDSFANVIHNYPYPYVIGNLCWEFPCVGPSDWESFNIQGKANPRLLDDWEAALDATVLKQGTMTLVFHPYGWSSPQQHVDLINYAQSKYGKRVKFLNFREALERLEKNVLGGQSLRTADGKDNGVRLLDLNHDGYMDVVIGNHKVRQTRIWSADKKQWIVTDFPTPIVNEDGSDAGMRFGIVSSDGRPSAFMHNEKTSGAWDFDGSRWVEDSALLAGLDADGPVLTGDHGRDRGVRLVDLDGDGRCELVVGNDKQNAVFAFNDGQKRWVKLPFALPAGTSFVDGEGRDAGLRVIDIDGDGRPDALFSNDDHYSFDLFTSMADGWSNHVRSGKHGSPEDIPALVRNGTNNGGWFLNRSLWVQNEDTAALPDLVDRRSYSQLLSGVFSSAHKPEVSLSNMQLRPGFKAELAAAEPLVQSPVHIAWGPDGRCWVTEMGDYPLGSDNKGAPGGRIVLLEDTHGDGRYTKATVFLDHLSYPTGVMPWGKGVLITCAPNILYAEDSKHDGHADIVKTLFTGFPESNPQHRVNGLQWGLDNWVHGATGHGVGQARSLTTSDVADIRGRDIRIRPDEGRIETTTGISQYGTAMNDWGDWFGCDNSNPDFQFVLDENYLRRNPHFLPPSPRAQVPDVPGASPVFPISPDLPRFNDFWALHHFTSACSIMFYRDDLFGPHFAGNSFVSEPVGNLVHREIVRRDGVLCHSSRAPDEQTSEFLASFDGWSRPTTIRTGPDGALWVVDMYRMVIEHPEWIPKEWQEKLDLRAGHELGRIYRIFPVGTRPRPIPRLDRLDAAGLVAALDSPSGWQRDMAQQLIVTRHETAAIPMLERAVAESQRDLCRLHALCTLDGLNAIKPEILEKALSDASPGVRRHAVRLSENVLAKEPHLGERVIQLASDPDAQVRMQVAYSLGEWDDPRTGEALGKLAATNRDDPYIEAAAMTSLTKSNLTPVLSAVMSASKGATPPTNVLANLLRFAEAVNDADAVSTVLKQVGQPHDGRFESWQFDAVDTLLDAVGSGGASNPTGVDQLGPMFDAARALVQSGSASEADRAAAIRLLAHSDRRREDVALLAKLLTPRTSPDLQLAAIRSIGRARDASTPAVLLGGWKAYSPPVRSEVVDTLLNRPGWITLLLDAVERKQILPTDIDTIRKQRLLAVRNAAIHERAMKLLADTTNPDRQKVVDAYQPALKLKGDAAHGAKVFATICVACHHFGGVGNAVGPDLASIGDKSPETLLVSILDPNRAVEPRFVGYVVDTNDGRSLTGVLGTETATSITLLQPNVPPVEILRTDIRGLRSTGLSLMPDGLESGLSPQDVADLIAHIRSVAPEQPRKEFAGNVPQTIAATGTGKIKLPASACEIRGSTVVYEPKYGNLGYWHSADDNAAWTVRFPRPGTYEVWLDYACDTPGAGNAFVVRMGTHELTGRIEATGSWDNYRQVKVGQIQADPGEARITFRAAGPISNYLCDLRGLELVPVP